MSERGGWVWGERASTVEREEEEEEEEEDVVVVEHRLLQGKVYDIHS